MRTVNQLFKTIAAAAVACAVALPAHADIIALESSRVMGDQSWTGALGLDFTVSGPIVVTQLGAFDSQANGFVQNIMVGIYTEAGALVSSLATLTTANTTLIGNSRFFDVPDFILAAGNYSIVAQGFNANDPNGNTSGALIGGPTPTSSSLVTFNGTGRYNQQGTAISRPVTADGGPSNRYDAGTFAFRAVPEPATLALFGLGLLGLGLSRRRIG